VVLEVGDELSEVVVGLGEGVGVTGGFGGFDGKDGVQYFGLVQVVGDDGVVEGDQELDLAGVGAVDAVVVGVEAAGYSG
jgi:hypothetical protein